MNYAINARSSPAIYRNTFVNPGTDLVNVFTEGVDSQIILDNNKISIHVFYSENE